MRKRCASTFFLMPYLFFGALSASNAAQSLFLIEEVVIVKDDQGQDETKKYINLASRKLPCSLLPQYSNVSKRVIYWVNLQGDLQEKELDVNNTKVTLEEFLKKKRSNFFPSA